MQGYFGQPEATSAAFVPSPLATGREELLYCTGDWVTIDERGDFIYLGRRDHMVKTRGYRVELGEIESALYAHPAVREAAAVAVPDDLLGNRFLWITDDIDKYDTADEGPISLIKHGAHDGFWPSLLLTIGGV